MKGTLSKTSRGWVVKQVIKEGPQAKLVNQYPLVDNGHIDGLALYKSNEGLEVEFEILTDYDNNGPNHFPKFARIIIPKLMILTPEEDELKDWDVTLNDGLEDEPYFTKPGFVEKRTNQMLEHLANEAFKSIGDDGLFPNHTDKDIWTAGFKAGYLKK
jgi:hypothetical protein